MPLDVTGWELLYVGGFWRHVNHTRKLATPGWLRRSGAIKNKQGYSARPGALELMAKRYAELYPA